MASETTNLHLVKPDQTEAVDVAPLNGNCDKIDEAYAALAAEITNKVDKVPGKGLSTNDFTDSYKEQITKNENGIAAVANAGVKNYMPNRAVSQTKNNIVYTVNPDGSMTVEIPADHGSSNTELSLFGSENVPDSLRGKTWILSGSPDGGGTSTWRLVLQNTSSGYSSIVTNASGDSEPFTLPNSITKIRLLFIVYKNCPAQTITVKPMVRDARVEDDTFVAYAPTNRELYEMILALQQN